MKSIFDRSVALVLLVLLLPVLLLTAVLIRLNLGSPVIFTQERPGQGAKRFHLYKFRSMTDQRGPDGELLPDHVRLTSFGQLVRKLSLDELPQLLNVLKGDMSLVGPRPLLVEYLELYSPEQRRRHDVKPGITGWAQINGRNALSWEEKFALDVWYVDHRTFWLDIKILWLTAKKVVVSEGISQQGHATMTKFTGSNHKAGL